MSMAVLRGILVNKNSCSSIHKIILCQTALGHEVVEQRKSQFSTYSSSKRMTLDVTAVEPIGSGNLSHRTTPGNIRTLPRSSKHIESLIH
jgi:hypothetical protein